MKWDALLFGVGLAFIVLVAFVIPGDQYVSAFASGLVTGHYGAKLLWPENS